MTLVRTLLIGLIYVLTAEKAIQHFLTSLFFIISIPGIGTPDIGPNFQIDSGIMAILNLAYFMSFVVGIVGMVKQKRWSIKLIIFLACLDIILEFLFHGFFFITVSVIVSTVLTAASLLYFKMEDKNIIKPKNVKNI